MTPVDDGVPLASDAEAPDADVGVGADRSLHAVLARLRSDAVWTSRRVGAPGCEKRRDAEYLVDMIDAFGPAWIERQRRVLVVRSLRDAVTRIELARSMDEVMHLAPELGMEIDELENELGLLRADGSSAAD